MKMKKILALAVAGAAMFSSSAAWAYERDGWSCRNDRFSRYGGHAHHHRDRGHGGYGLRVVYYSAPIRYQTVACAVPSQTMVVNVSNPNGSYTPVTLRQEGGTYVGPRGERYLQMPTEEQLRQVYGLK